MYGYIDNSDGKKSALVVLRKGDSDLILQTYSTYNRAVALSPAYVLNKCKEPLVRIDQDGSIELSGEQRFKLERLWFVYGNHGPKHTHAAHRYIQCILEQGSDDRAFFKPGREVIEAVTAIIYFPEEVTNG